ncbi:MULTISPECIES: enoyl-CoA hydratase/isomerase family protein [Pseudonocardia]|uniref:Enoyl-CoA hydratase n=2 Tax=Pseudonocardia TaxID=1847 RepID=A0ABQ0RZ23_9PSEU|nr:MULTISPECIES: enoyl-CoA hydratase-related protein [Pseudonocardia]OSY37086.1 putative enoyl-CoA hydratase echA8 [Pseudonocardia autotrophica]TDN72058.1 enoyl-CoA hydratase [Pseudonocardia autotrophica]BBG02756.1 enoyl-CoA hydratase [Pseudonocardia autotrophica]GEC25911.1 enoyl-CoA hydratase [Pseudonocardia saturnea]
MPETPTTFRLERPRDGVVVLTLDRPAQYNAMTAVMFRELESAGRALDREPALRAVVLTGAGKAFCAGYDLADAEKLTELGALGMLDLQESAARALTAIRGIRVPVIAAVNGAAAGGGLALALAADIRLASPRARFVPSFVTIGLSAGDLGTSWLLPRLVGPAVAAEFLYSARTMAAAEAEETGLVNRVVPEEELLDSAVGLAAQICGNSPGGVQLSKRALHANMEASSYAAALELENRGQALLTRSDDMTEALAAFQEKRAPVFEGR